MKLTKTQTMQQHKTPRAADGIIIKNHARKQPAAEPCESITQQISTNTAGEKHKLPGSLQNKQPKQFIVEESRHDKTENRKANHKANRKIRRRIEQKQINGGHIGLAFDTVQCVRCKMSTGINSEKKTKGGKTEPDTSSRKAASGCRCTFLLLIFVTHNINEIGNVTFKKERNGKNLHPPITFFPKNNHMTPDTLHLTPSAKGDQIVSKKKNGRPYYFRLHPMTAGKLDAIITRIGYASRTEYFNAVAQFTVKKFGDEANGKDTTVPDLPPELKAWITEQKPPLTEEEVKTHLEETIRCMLFPVLALRGADIAHETAWKNLRSIFREEHGMWLTESDIRVALEEFASVHHGELTDYRNKVLEGETPEGEQV